MADEKRDTRQAMAEADLNEAIDGLLLTDDERSTLEWVLNVAEPLDIIALANIIRTAKAHGRQD